MKAQEELFNEIKERHLKELKKKEEQGENYQQFQCSVCGNKDIKVKIYEDYGGTLYSDGKRVIKLICPNCENEKTF